MLFTRKLITEFIPEFVNVTDQAFTNAVNALGMEVESIFKYPEVNNVVIGKLLEANKVEGTHLSLCKVKINDDTTNTIVCGASNLIVGKYVLVALEGARLPNGVTIAKREIHGMESNGMMCAYPELTNNKAVVADAEQDEIIMLDDGIVGSDKWQSLIGLDDTIYDISVPANRNDENCYYVFCYELANKLNLQLKNNILDIVKQYAQTGDVNLNANPKICSCLAFLDYELNEKLISRSNWTLKSLLMNHGVKPFNYLMDKLAFITLLTNCPTNVYDADKVVGQIKCKQGSNGLKFIALNGKAYDLTKEDIVIHDQNQPIALACVIGSEYTKLTGRTSRIKIEVGNFNYANVRNTSIRLNIDTDAAKRASRPLSNYLNLATIELIKKEFGQPTSISSFIKPNWITKLITLGYRTLEWFIDEEISKDFAASALRKLGYKFNILKTKFSVPLWRLDVKTQEDMFEDILKIIDINQLKSIEVEDKLLPIQANLEYDLRQEIKDVMLNNYFNEVKTYNLTNKDNLNKFNLFKVNNPIKIICNNSNREYFRTNLIDNMLKVFKYNDARKLELMPIFETQALFTNSSKSLNLTALALDKYNVDSITKSVLYTNVNYFKDIVNQIACVLNTRLTFKPIGVEQFYNNESVGIYHNDTIIGYIGKIRKSQLKPYDLNNKDIYALTINLETLFANYKKQEFKVKSFGAFQRLSKDVNIVLDKEKANEINARLDAITKLADVVDAKIINIFEKEGKMIYTVRYYLTDTKQFTTNDIEVVARQIDKLNSL